jgi:hypothetical protein
MPILVQQRCRRDLGRNEREEEGRDVRGGSQSNEARRPWLLEFPFYSIDKHVPGCTPCRR